MTSCARRVARGIAPDRHRSPVRARRGPAGAPAGVRRLAACATRRQHRGATLARRLAGSAGCWSDGGGGCRCAAAGVWTQAAVVLQKTRESTATSLAAAWARLAPGGRLLLVGGNEVGIASAVRSLGGRWPRCRSCWPTAPAPGSPRLSRPIVWGRCRPLRPASPIRPCPCRCAVRPAPSLLVESIPAAPCWCVAWTGSSRRRPASWISPPVPACWARWRRSAGRWPGSPLPRATTARWRHCARTCSRWAWLAAAAQRGGTPLSPHRWRRNWCSATALPPGRRQGGRSGPGAQHLPPAPPLLHRTGLIVANRQLPYERELASVGVCECVAQEQGFKVLRWRR